MPATLTPAERAQKRKLEAALNKREAGSKKRASKKLKPSFRLRPSLKTKPSAKNRPSLKAKPAAEKKKEKRAEEKKEERAKLTEMNATISRIRQMATEAGMPLSKISPTTPKAPSKTKKSLSTDSLASESVETATPTPQKKTALVEKAQEIISATEEALVQAEAERAKAEKEKAKAVKDQARMSETRLLLQKERETLTQKAGQVISQLESVLAAPELTALRQLQEDLNQAEVEAASKISASLVQEAEKKPVMESSEGVPASAPQAPEGASGAAPASSEEAAAPAPEAAGSSLSEPGKILQSTSAALPDSEKKYVVVACEQADDNWKGVRGILSRYEGEKCHFTPLFAAGGASSEGGVKVCPTAWTKEISEQEAKRAQLPRKLNTNWISKPLAAVIFEQLWFKPQDKLKDVSTRLAMDHLDAGVAEILWRLLPGKGVLVMPAGLTYQVHIVRKDIELAVQRTEQEKNLYGEEEKIVEAWKNLAKRAEHLLIPISNGHHYTLLYLERSTPAKPAASTGYIHGLNASNNQQRKELERQQFECLEWPILEATEMSQILYFESIKLGTSAIRVARSALAMLREIGWQIPDADPERGNTVFQHGDVQCGLWVLHYVEELVRASQGEHRGTFPIDFQHRFERVNEMVEKLAKKSSLPAVKA